ncbi:hypothetical protein C9374_002891 [Naegleria lovaniensis]|uniref:YABBY protein C-terminal domain-containing protein n=1 Tax=Naegleria lovaniensis TaxID=51637 RepID=A0AA88GRK7_NAELO|nr:uncharacterized protein C9374_002891 [Naegleria lovaniensis]KAG2385742.1 hypothetical protein C9374_002891 [Naegleria lovaniensis]
MEPQSSSAAATVDEQMPLSSSSSNSPSSLTLPSSPSASTLHQQQSTNTPQSNIMPPSVGSNITDVPSSSNNHQQQSPSSSLNNTTNLPTNRPESLISNISFAGSSIASANTNHNTSNGGQHESFPSSHQTATSPIGVSSLPSQNKPLNDFENIYSSFKKRNREQYEQHPSSSSSTTESYVKDLEDKVDFMAQLITIQSAKMRKMEVRLRKLESLLPQAGDEFVNSNNLHRIPMIASSSGGGANIDEISTISDDLPTFTATPKKEKGNRQPNAYNIFMKSEIQRIRTTHTELTQKQAFKLAASNWSLKKAEIMAAQKKGIDPITLVTGASSDLKAGSSAVSTPSDTTIPDNLSSGTPAILDEK